MSTIFNRTKLRIRLFSIGAASIALAGCTTSSPPAAENVGRTSAAVAVTGLSPTGANGSTVLTSTQPDPNYVLTSSADAAYAGPRAFVVGVPAGNAQGWVPDTSTGAWINPRSDGGDSVSTGSYTYELTFDIPVGIDPASVSLTGSWACDDSCVLDLNGKLVATSPSAAYKMLSTFNVAAGSGFIVGENVLDFIVDNSGGGPSGLLVSTLTTGASCTSDTTCGTGAFCSSDLGASPGVCTLQGANGALVPGGTCTATIATHACVSGACDTNGTVCGIKSGDGTCSNSDQCVSGTCRTGTDVGKCAGCTSDNDCAGATPVCDATTLTCVGCNGNNASTSSDPCPSDVPTCLTTGATAGECVSEGCSAIVPCPTGYWCNDLDAVGLLVGQCQPLVPNGGSVHPIGDPGATVPCSAGIEGTTCESGVCDTNGNVCGIKSGDPGCTSTEECIASVCVTSGPKANTCQPCSADSDCTDPTAPACSSSNTCVTCTATNSTACTGTTPVCNATTNGCVACNGNNGSSGTHSCPTTAPFCDTTSGACSTGCLNDGDCPTGDWCDTLNAPATCAAKVPNGGGVPGGTCNLTSADGCVSGVCDPIGNVCGFGAGDGPCANNADCTTGVCVTSGVDIHKCEGCNGDSDCGASSVCGPANTCVQCTPTDAKTCTGSKPICDGLSDTCVACNGDNGTSSTHACASSSAPYCELTGASAGSCGKCTSDTDCGTGHGGSFCNTTTGACGNACALDVECGAGHWCNDLATPGTGTCQPKVTNGNPIVYGAAPGTDATCSTTLGLRACTSAVCDTTSNLCGIGLGDGTCASTMQCISGVCATTGTDSGKCEQCTSSATCGGTTPACGPSDTCVQCTAGNTAGCTGTTPACNTTTNNCAACDGDNGMSVTTPCPSSGEPYCALTGASTGACGKCTTNADCGTGHAGAICDTTTGACGSTCTVDSDCNVATQWCNAGVGGSGVCVSKLPNGTVLPLIPVSVAVCTSTVGTRVCLSGVCDPTGNVCGLNTGDGTCTTTAECTVGVCVTTGANAGKCEACGTDGDCPMATPVCSPTNTCVVCEPGDSAACVGATPVCNATTTSCAPCLSDNGSGGLSACPTTSAPYCTTVGIDIGQCGQCATNADCVGHAGPICDTATGSCGTGCTSDSQCPSTQWCTAPTGGTGSCVDKLDNGTPLPTTPTTVATCTTTVGTRVCKSGVCDPADNDCGLANGDGSCNGTNSECRDGVCASDNVCGNPIGGSCTTTSDCRASTCVGGICGGGLADSGPTETGTSETGTTETGVSDTGSDGSTEGGVADTSSSDAGDAGVDATDASTSDASSDTASNDAADGSATDSADASATDSAVDAFADATSGNDGAVNADGSLENGTVSGSGFACSTSTQRSSNGGSDVAVSLLGIAAVVMARRRRR